MQIAKIFLFVKDEKYLIQKWLPYYINIFGENNIHILDHGSKDGTLDIIKDYKIKVNDCANHQFKNKHTLLTRLMSQYKKECKFLIPTDSDEFLFHMDQKNNININKELILNTLENHKTDLKSKFLELRSVLEQMEYSDPLNEINLFKCMQSVLPNNCLIDASFKKTSRWYAKTFYPADKFINTDQGNHCGKIQARSHYNYTSLGFFHFQCLGYKHWCWKNRRGLNSYGILQHGRLPSKYNGAGSAYFTQVRHMMGNDKGESWFRDNHIRLHQRDSSDIKKSHYYFDEKLANQIGIDKQPKYIRTDVFKDYLSSLG